MIEGLDSTKKVIKKEKINSKHLNRNLNKDRSNNIIENIYTSSGIDLIDKLLIGQ